MDPKIIRVDGQKQRVTALGLKRSRNAGVEICLHVRRRQLKVVRGHVTIGARATVSTQVCNRGLERAETAFYRLAGLAAWAPARVAVAAV
jgi:hypothetical protein